MSIWHSEQGTLAEIYPPSGSIVVSEGETFILDKGLTREFVFTIPLSNNFFLQGFNFGAYSDKPNSDKAVNSRCVLFWQPAGNAVGPPPESAISIIYLNNQGSVPEVSFPNQNSFAGVNFLGNGIKRFVLRVENKGLDSIEFTNRIRGYFH